MDLSLKETEPKDNPLESEISLNLGNEIQSQPLNQPKHTSKEELPVSTQTLDNNTNNEASHKQDETFSFLKQNKHTSDEIEIHNEKDDDDEDERIEFSGENLTASESEGEELENKEENEEPMIENMNIKETEDELEKDLESDKSKSKSETKENEVEEKEMEVYELKEMTTTSSKKNQSEEDLSSYGTPRDNISVSSDGMGKSSIPLNSHEDKNLEETESSEDGHNSFKEKKYQSTDEKLDNKVISEIKEMNGETSYKNNNNNNTEINEVTREDHSIYKNKPISHAARELTLKGIRKGTEKALAKSISGLATEVLQSDEGKLGSPLEDEKWRQHKRHFFIFSVAGKPIYSRHGDENGLSGMMAIMDAIFSVVLCRKETIRTVMTSNCKIVFYPKDPMILVAVTKRDESDIWIERQLEYLYNLILFLATAMLIKMLERNPNKDIRGFLKGSSNVMEGIIKGFSLDLSFLVEAYCPVRILKDVREEANDVLKKAVEHCGARCGLIWFNGQMLTCSQDIHHPLHIEDMLILQNFVLSNTLYSENCGVEFNTPICLPHLHQTAFLHAYITYISKNPDLVVVLLMTQPENFHLASEARKILEKNLTLQGVIHTLKYNTKKSKFYESGQIKIQELPLSAGGGSQNSSMVQFFLFKLHHKVYPQYVYMISDDNLTNKKLWKKLIRALSKIHSISVKKEKITNEVHWQLDNDHAILSLFETEWMLQVVCDPLAIKEQVLKISREIIRYVTSSQMKEELFIIEE